MMPSHPFVPRPAGMPGRLSRVALALLQSLLAHGAVLWMLSRPVPPRLAPPPRAPMLIVRLEPRPAPSAPAEPQAVPPPPRPERADRPARRPPEAAPQAKRPPTQEKDEEDREALPPAAQTPDRAAAPEGGAAAQPAPLDLDTEAAVRATLHPRRLVERPVAKLPGPAPEPEAPTALGQRMAQAAIPDCLRPDATSKTGIPLGGLLALPVIAYAKLAGKCH